MNAMQTAVTMLTNLLASGDYDTVERMTRGRRLSAADLRTAVERYGRTLVALPQEAVQDLDVVEVRNSEPPTFSVVIDLWTAEEGRSDLTLELELVDRFDGAYEVSIQNLHVL